MKFLLENHKPVFPKKWLKAHARDLSFNQTNIFEPFGIRPRIGSGNRNNSKGIACSHFHKKGIATPSLPGVWVTIPLLLVWFDYKQYFRILFQDLTLTTLVDQKGVIIGPGSPETLRVPYFALPKWQQMPENPPF